MTITAAAAALTALAGCASKDESAAFAAAKAAVSGASTEAASVVFSDLKLRSLEGLKGSKAQVVCGEVSPGKDKAGAQFLYIWKLEPAVEKPGRAVGDVQVFKTMDRHAAGTLTQFCSEGVRDRKGVTDWTYFN
jgi:hypothetical protein